MVPAIKMLVSLFILLTFEKDNIQIVFLFEILNFKFC